MRRCRASGTASEHGDECDARGDTRIRVPRIFDPPFAGALYAQSYLQLMSPESNRRSGSRHAPKAPSRRAVPRWQLVAAAILIIALAWWLWPSSLRNVTNLDSRGTSVVAFGDSLTAGYGVAAEESYPDELGELTGIEIVNSGVSGDTTEAALSRVSDDVLSYQPRIVIVGLGGNDFLRRVPIDTTEQNLREIVRRIQAGGAMVVLLGFRFPSFGPSYEKMYERIADEEGCLLIPDVLDGILNDPALKSDDIHPNARGYSVMAARVAPQLRKVLDRR